MTAVPCSRASLTSLAPSRDRLGCVPQRDPLTPGDVARAPLLEPSHGSCAAPSLTVLQPSWPPRALSPGPPPGPPTWLTHSLGQSVCSDITSSKRPITSPALNIYLNILILKSHPTPRAASSPLHTFVNLNSEWTVLVTCYLSPPASLSFPRDGGSLLYAATCPRPLKWCRAHRDSQQPLVERMD